MKDARKPYFDWLEKETKVRKCLCKNIAAIFKAFDRFQDDKDKVARLFFEKAALDDEFDLVPQEES